jgi:hypothetical protein
MASCPEILNYGDSSSSEGLLVLLWRRCLAFYFVLVAKVLKQRSDEKDLS